MTNVTQRSKRALDAMKDRFAERLGEVLYRLYVQEIDPFSAPEIREDKEPA